MELYLECLYETYIQSNLLLKSTILKFLHYGNLHIKG